MKKAILIFSFAMATMMGVPVYLSAAEMSVPGIEQMIEDDITVVVNRQTVTVQGGQGQTLEVVSLTGRRVMTVKIESQVQKIELNIPKGCYILKIGKVVRKVSVL